MAQEKAKVVHGPGPRGVGGPAPKVENPGKLLKRIMGEVFQALPAPLHHRAVLHRGKCHGKCAGQPVFCRRWWTITSSPMTQQANPRFCSPLLGALLKVGCIYLVGIIAAWLNARIMVNVTQGTLRNLRVQLFTHMESLPIKYFDQHPPRRYHVRLHQRCGYPAPDAQPEHPAAHLQRHHHRFRLCQHGDAGHPSHRRHHADGSPDAVLHQEDHLP